MKTLKLIGTLIILEMSFLTYAGQNQFCAGYGEGFKSNKGTMAIVPICPIGPITPINSTDFREGLKAGSRAADKVKGKVFGIQALKIASNNPGNLISNSNFKNKEINLVTNPEPKNGLSSLIRELKAYTPPEERKLGSL